ncbi:class II heat shock protein [Tanacetum coccineum]
MASDGSDPDAEYALSSLLQRGTVAEYQNEFEMLISRVMRISNSLLASIYIGGLKPALQRALLWSNPTTLGEAFSLARIAKARFPNQGPTTTSATPNLKPPTSPVLTIGGSQNKASDSPTTLEVAHEVAPAIPSEALRETTTTADTVAKIEETGEFYTSEEHGTKPEKGESNDDGFKWGVQEASNLEELKHRLSTTPVLSLPDFNEVFFIEADASANVIGTEPLEEPIAIHDWQVVLTAMQRRLWDPGIKSAFQDDTLRARWFSKEWEMLRP